MKCLQPGICSLLFVLQVCADPQPAREGFPRWFNEAKAGMFIHWGLYSIPADEWKGRQGNRDAHIQHEFRIPLKEYSKLPELLQLREESSEIEVEMLRPRAAGHFE